MLLTGIESCTFPIRYLTGGWLSEGTGAVFQIMGKKHVSAQAFRWDMGTGVIHRKTGSKAHAICATNTT
jgi:hypothetical protein